MCRFLVHLSTDLQYSTINNYLSGLILLHKVYGLPCEFRCDIRVQFTLRGIRRELGDQTKRKDPLLPPDLKKIQECVDFGNQTDFAVWACIVLGFRTLLRKSNLLPGEHSIHCVKRGDVKFYKWGMTLLIRSSKTIQHKERALEIPVVRTPKSILCAVSLLEHHFMTAPGTSSDYLFLVPTRKGYQPLNYSTALGRLKKWSHIACPDKDIAFHSLRRGSATYMSSIGISLENIKSAGDWASLAVLVYLAAPLTHSINIDKLVANSLLY